MVYDRIKALLVRSGVVGVAAVAMSAASASSPTKFMSDGALVELNTELVGSELRIMPVLLAAEASVEASSEQDGGAVQSITVAKYRTEVDGKVVEVELRNNEVTLATLDGRAIPRSRILRDQQSGGITILGDDNAVIAQFPAVSPPPATTPTSRQRAVVRVSPTPPAAPAPPYHTLPPTTSMRPTPGQAELDVVVDRVPTSLIGIVPRDHPDRVAVVIDGVREGLGADRAGLQAGDLILSVDGLDEINADRLRQLIGNRKPGTEIRLTIERDGRRSDINVTTSENPYSLLQPARPQVFVSGRGEGGREGEGAWVIRGHGGAAGGIPADGHDVQLEWDGPGSLLATPLVGRDVGTLLRFHTAEQGDLASMLAQIREQVKVELEAIDLGSLEKRLTDRLTVLLEPVRPEGGMTLRLGEARVQAQSLEARLGEIENRLSRMEALLQRISEQQGR